MRTVLFNVITCAIFYAILLLTKSCSSFETAVFFALAHLMARNAIKEVENENY
jgi:hypothetical protein